MQKASQVGSTSRWDTECTAVVADLEAATVAVGWEVDWGVADSAVASGVVGWAAVTAVVGWEAVAGTVAAGWVAATAEEG